MEQGLLVRLVKVKLAPDETLLAGRVLKRGGSVKSWRPRFASLDGDGCLRYYSDSSRRKLKGCIDIRRDCTAIMGDSAEANWPTGTEPKLQLCICTELRTYFLVCDSIEDAATWRAAILRVARQMQSRWGAQHDRLSILSESETPDLLNDDGDVVRREDMPVAIVDPENTRCRKHMFKNAVTNGQHQGAKGCQAKECASKNHKIGIRMKHNICTQCRKRYHLECLPVAVADCQPPVFGTPEAVKRVAPPPGSNLASAAEFTSTHGYVPGLVEDLISIVDSRGMVEGVYRVPGNKGGMKLIIERYFSDPRKMRLGVYTIESVHTCSSALKLFLRDYLDEPLITFDTYHEFIEAILDKPNCVERMTLTLSKLPIHNFYTLKVLIEHLQRVAANVEETKMKMSNLAAVFAPTLMQAPGGDREGLQHVMPSMKCVDVLLKLSKETWEEAEAIVKTTNRVNSSSPTPESNRDRTETESISPSPKRTMSESASKSRALSDDESTSPRPMSSHSADVLATGAEATIKRIQGLDQSIHRVNPLFDSSVSSEYQEEVEHMLGEVLDHSDEDFCGFKDVDVVTGEAPGALLAGFETFSLDSLEASALTLDNSGRRRKAGLRISADLLEQAEEE
eukprot:m.226238 g.226238  ORF g.226238 m.226238 type:complete len:623 (-) comp33487_c0_seq7:206-2074(-)